MIPDHSHLDPEIVKRLNELEKKYNAMGQDLVSYLDGLLHSDFLTYWDYINLDTLLSLQQPKTPFKDEMVFIIYHQITELYFKLILHEIHQVTILTKPNDKIFLAKIRRMNRYFDQLSNSFDIMVDGMSRKEFMNFRMSLLPSSGFQSAQYRLIEIGCTDVINLVSLKYREALIQESDFEILYDHIYWKEGASELATGEKTLTLKQFEEKYSNKLIRRMATHKDNNLNQLLLNNFSFSDISEEIIHELRKLDLNANINWPLAHYRSAARHLQRDPEVIAATGGTNWQKYLPPRFQKVIFFPSLWASDELENWGHNWVKDLLQAHA
ncbi:MAG: tryptophan 2,3-dioxygenase family protein [Bacteroidetes bacterium]|nr:tryptophan 2,3-dioxygenase family protein [Bacteroidota bacterium]MDA1119837.1 tryptophan 2,3-dioxygenase family protein [Bacteroidota bacterium]